MRQTNKAELDALINSVSPSSNDDNKENINISYFIPKDDEATLFSGINKADFARLVLHYIHSKQVIY